MFKIDDFFNILKYLKGDPVSDATLDPKFKVIADSERGISTNYFEKILDQIAHSSEDYQRLRKFMVDWYSSHRSLATVGKQVNDVFSLPDDHVDELIRSYGFNYPSDVLQYFTNKRNFFLDLVNLYKIKGTPESIIKVLTYYGFGEIDIGEYWLKKDDFGELVFEGQKVTGTGSLILNKWTDPIPYDTMTLKDPHWFMKKSQAEELIRRGKFGLPTKSPYFSLRPKYDMSAIDQVFSAVIWKLHKDYNYWQSGGTLVKDIKIRELNYMVSFLELYTAMVYTFNETFQRQVGSTDLNIVGYDGTATTIAEIQDEYENIIINPQTRDQRQEYLDRYFRDFSVSRTTHPFEFRGQARDVLQLLNPDLKARIDSFLSTGRGLEPLGALMREFDYWVQNNVKAGAPFLSLIVLGLESDIINDIKQLVNFFKPYRARMASVEILYVNKNPLLDSIRLDDYLLETPKLWFDDYINWGKPCCTDPELQCPDLSDDSYYNRDTYDCGSYHDIGASFDKRDCFIYVRDEIDDSRLVCRKGWDANQDSGYHLDSSAQIDYVWVDGGWSDFDESGIFDCLTTMENVQITVIETPSAP